MMTRHDAQEILSALEEIRDAAEQVEQFAISPIVGAKMKDIQQAIKQIRSVVCRGHLE